MLLVWLALAWIAGIVAADVFSPPDRVLWMLAVFGLVAAGLLWRVPAGGRLVGLLLLVAALGSIRYEPVEQARAAVTIWRLADRGTVVVTGFVAEDPKRSEDGQQVVLETEQVLVGKAGGVVRGRLLLLLPPYPAYAYGQQLAVYGRVQEPPIPRRVGTFDYRDYLARKGIFAQMREPQVQVLPGVAGSPLLRGLLAVRTYCDSIILRLLPEPQASVASGIILGLKASIPDETYQDFTTSGLVHILVISGWHLSLVAGMMTDGARRLHLGRAATFWFSLGAIWLYALFVGASPTVLRAAIMASLVVLARATERRTEPWTLLLAACWGITLHNPQALWDTGFQLSVLATAGIMAFYAPMKAWLERITPWTGGHWLTDSVAVSLAAQTLVLPVIVYSFGRFSLVFPLSNVALVPVVPYVMIPGAVALAVGVVADVLRDSPAIGPFAWMLAEGAWMLVWLPLSLLTQGVRLLASIPGASVSIPTFPAWLAGLYYLAVGGWWGWRQRVVCPIQRTA